MNSPYSLPADCYLSSEDFLRALAPESLAAFNQIKHGAVFPEGAVIFVEGETPRGIFMLCQGQAKLSTTSRDGKTFILRIAKPGDFLGLHSVVTDKPYDATVETMQPCQLNFVSREDFLRFLKEHGDACLQAAQQFSRQCLDAHEVVRSIGLSHSVSGRVAKVLLASATDGQVKKGVVRVKLVLTHEEIAQIIGTSRESITRILLEFRKKEIVELKGSTLTIHNKPALEQLVAAGLGV